MKRLSMDIDIAHRRRWPDRPMSLASRLWLLARSSGLRLMLIHRIEHWRYANRAASDDKKAWFWRLMVIPFLPMTLVTNVSTKSVIDSRIEIDGGVCFSDLGHIIFGAMKTGTGTVIGTQVTVGQSHIDGGRPEIGRNVWIGSDCVIYGAINIGDGATLLPNTVLTKSIPAGVVMQGNPARLVLRNFDNTELREHQDIDAVQYVNSRRGD